MFFVFSLTRTMKKFHDVEIYAGKKLATTGSRLELAANNPWLRQIFSEMNFCDGCKDPLGIIIADEDENTVRDAFKTGLSIIQSKYYNNIMFSILNKNHSRSSEGEGSVGTAELRAGYDCRGPLLQEDSERE